MHGLKHPKLGPSTYNMLDKIAIKKGLLYIKILTIMFQNHMISFLKVLLSTFLKTSLLYGLQNYGCPAHWVLIKAPSDCTFNHSEDNNYYKAI